LSCTDCKAVLANNLITLFEEFRQRKAELQAQPELVQEILADGASRVRLLVQAKVAQMSELMGLSVP